MYDYNTPRSRAGGPGHLIIAIVVFIILIAIIYWGVTHPPTRRRGGALPPPVPVLPTSIAGPGIPPPGGGPVEPAPTLSPGEVMVFTIDGHAVCRGYPVGELGYHLQCGAPAGVNLFRVVNAAGESALAVRYTDEVLIRVGP
ncbi:hypothetical protein D6833_06140 [Candidatus Parcubacteria bacterium]|nr:MAG: hypothetical protein D6833_06140 [Candidatus Parcubacteria bacterium]